MPRLYHRHLSPTCYAESRYESRRTHFMRYSILKFIELYLSQRLYREDYRLLALFSIAGASGILDRGSGSIYITA